MSCFKRIRGISYLAASMAAMAYAFLVEYWLLQTSNQPTRFNVDEREHR